MDKTHRNHAASCCGSYTSSCHSVTAPNPLSLSTSWRGCWRIARRGVRPSRRCVGLRMAIVRPPHCLSPAPPLGPHCRFYRPGRAAARCTHGHTHRRSGRGSAVHAATQHHVHGAQPAAGAPSRVHAASVRSPPRTLAQLSARTSCPIRFVATSCPSHRSPGLQRRPSAPRWGKAGRRWVWSVGGGEIGASGGTRLLVRPPEKTTLRWRGREVRV